MERLVKKQAVWMECSMDESQIRELEEKVKRLKMIQYLTIAMNETQDPQELLILMLDKSIAITGADSGSIMLKDSFSKQLRFVVFRGLDENVVNTVQINIGDGLTGIVCQDGIPRLINDVSMDPVYISVKKDIQSELAVPLAVHGKVLGVLNVDSTRKNAFTEDDLELLHTIANQAAQILIRSRLTMELERRVRQQELLIDISQAIEKVHDFKTVFDIVMKKLEDNFGILRGMLVMFEAEDFTQLSVVTAFNITDEEMSRGIYKVGEGVVGKVVETAKAISIPDINHDPSFLNRMQIRRDKNVSISFIAVPIRLEGMVLGVLTVERPFENIAILQDDENMLTLVANAISNKVKLVRRISEEKESLVQENLSLKKELIRNYNLQNIIGKNQRMQEVFDLVDMVADSSSSILILGESGTGKELIAKALHYNSSRRDKPFVSINCASIPENLLESELFGYKKGAFTGANTDKKGKFQVANTGTIFLDEIGDMPLYLQAKLLRVLQEREIEPVGSETKTPVDIRVISATNKQLDKLVKGGEFREDLYYRLNVVEIHVPALRERKDDIPLLVHHFIQKYTERDGKKVDGITQEALMLLQSYQWPGNVRELENVVERAVLLCRTRLIEIMNLPSFLAGSDEIPDIQISKWVDNFVKNLSNSGVLYQRVIGHIEKELITKALIYNNRNKVKTSEYLGINRNTLRSKMEEYGIRM
jgi:Nif-specific regulatory protein